MNAADGIVVLWVLIAALAGYRRGLLTQVFSLAGIVVGAYVGSRIAPNLLSGGEQSPWLPLAGLVGGVIGAILLQVAAGMAGSVVRTAVVHGPFRLADGVGGLVFGGAVGLALAWLVAAVALNQPMLGLRPHVQGSAVLTGLVERVPPGAVLRALGSFDPLPLLSGMPDARLPEPDASVLRSRVAVDAKESVVKVVGTACGLQVTGSGWVVRRGLVATNAHVVAGQSGTTVLVPQSDEAPDGQRLQARLVYMDAVNDVALLRVSGIASAPLPVARSDPRGEEVVMLGYPHGGKLTAEAGRAGRPTKVLAPDAYDRRMHLRTVVPLRGEIVPGDSGGPVLGADGAVVSMVFGSTRRGTGGFGVPLAAIRAALRAELRSVPRGRCAA